jgi:hypothetical protein
MCQYAAKRLPLPLFLVPLRRYHRFLIEQRVIALSCHFPKGRCPTCTWFGRRSDQETILVPANVDIAFKTSLLQQWRWDAYPAGISDSYDPGFHASNLRAARKWEA